MIIVQIISSNNIDGGAVRIVIANWEKWKGRQPLRGGDGKGGKTEILLMRVPFASCNNYYLSNVPVIRGQYAKIIPY